MQKPSKVLCGIGHIWDTENDTFEVQISKQAEEPTATKIPILSKLGSVYRVSHKKVPPLTEDRYEAIRYHYSQS